MGSAHRRRNPVPERTDTTSSQSMSSIDSGPAIRNRIASSVNSTIGRPVEQPTETHDDQAAADRSEQRSPDHVGAPLGLTLRCEYAVVVRRWRVREAVQ